MSFLENILFTLFPTLPLQTTPWLGLWREKERASVLLASRVLLAACVPIYIAHHYFVDIPLGVKPEVLWASYRFGMAALCVAAFLLTYSTPCAQGQAYRLPVAVVGLVGGYMQARSGVWFPKIPYLYALIIPSIAALLAQGTPLWTACYLLGLLLGVFEPHPNGGGSRLHHQRNSRRAHLRHLLSLACWVRSGLLSVAAEGSRSAEALD